MAERTARGLQDFYSTFYKASRHSSSSQLDQQQHSAVSTRTTSTTRSPTDAAVRPLWARERARTARMRLVACLDVHMLAVHMLLCRPARCVSQLQASQPASNLSGLCQPASSIFPVRPSRVFHSIRFSSVQFSSVQFSSVQLVGPRVVVRMPFDLDPCF